MTTKTVARLAIYIIVVVIVLSACASQAPQTNNLSTNSTGIIELDRIIDIVLRGDAKELQSVIRLTQTRCTFAEGLGGPPKCLEGEQEGTQVDVLPFLGPEGYFLRRAELESWEGLDVSAVFAVYEFATPIFIDPNYPAGKYAIVFVGTDENTSVTLRVDQGNIVRIDYSYEYPPTIREDEVIHYLIQPTGANP